MRTKPSAPRLRPNAVIVISSGASTMPRTALTKQYGPIVERLGAGGFHNRVRRCAVDLPTRACSGETPG